MALQIDRVRAQLQLLRKSGDSADGGELAALGDSRELLVRRLRPIVLDILGEHLRGLERGGIL
jgi:hypothetical protein